MDKQIEGGGGKKTLTIKTTSTSKAILDKTIKKKSIGINTYKYEITPLIKEKINYIKSSFIELGWEKKYINNKFKKDDGRLIDEYSTQEYLKIKSYQWLKTLKIINKLDQNNKAFLNLFLKIGLTQKTSSLLLSIIEPIFDTCYNNEDLFDIAINYLVNDSEELGTPKQKFLFNNKPKNKWISHDSYKYIYNYSHGNLDINPINNNIDIGLNLDNKKILYHATSWFNTKKILENHVSHQEGRLCQDFGKYRGFYTTTSFEDATEWCIKNSNRWNAETAILIFIIDLEQIKPYKHKIFENPNDEWSHLVSQSRQCHVNDLDSMKFIYGPMSQNMNEMVYNNKKAIPHSPIKYQFCSKSSEIDEYLSKNYSRTIFFNKQK